VLLRRWLWRFWWEHTVKHRILPEPNSLIYNDVLWLRRALYPDAMAFFFELLSSALLLYKALKVTARLRCGSGSPKKAYDN
jgi:hypothetical protein